MASVSRAGKAHRHVHGHHSEVKKGGRAVKKGSNISQHEVHSDPKIKKIAELVLRAKSWTSESEAKRIIQKHGQHKFERMLMACENITKLSQDVGLTKDQLFKMAKYIEVKLPQKVKHGKAYLKKEKTGLARTIEFKSNRAFIHLKTHGVQALGAGVHKRVTISIMYAAHKPEIVANGVGDATVMKEGKVLKKLRGSEGIAKTYAVSSHKSDHKKVYSIISKLYNARTVRHYEYNRSSMNHDEEVYIARDLMKGLESMHAKRMAHRDLHSGNFMVNRQEDPDTKKVKITAALIDFGQVVSFDKAKKLVPRIEVSRHLITPESLIKGKHRVDVRKVEAFAVGCSLYHLFFGSGPEWCEMMREQQVKKMSKRKRKELSNRLITEIYQTIDKRRKELAASNLERKDLAEVIFKLLDPSAKERSAPHKARKQLDQIIKKMES